jgi:hypothetical protein
MFKNSNDPMVKALWELAKDIVREQKVDSTGGSTHYYAIPEGVPYWAKGECWIPGPRIGSHQFGQERSAEMWGTYSSGKRCDPKKPGSFKGM